MTGIAAGTGALAGVAFGAWGALAVAAAAVIVLVLNPRDRSVAAVCGVAVAASLLGGWRAGADSVKPPRPPLVEPPRLAAVAAAPVRTGVRQFFVAETPPRDDGEGARWVICVTAGPFPRVHLGDLVRFEGDVVAARDAAAGRGAALRARGCDAAAYATALRVEASTASPARLLADVRARITETLRRAAPGDAGVLLSGLVTGDDAGFSPARQEAFVRTGTTHLTAVSGSNLALVAGLLATVGVATVGRHRIAWQAATIAGVWAYALVSGAAAPAVRAAIVATAAVLAFRVGRRADLPTLILLAAAVMALADPRQVNSLGFQLSVAASLALALTATPLVTRGPGAALATILAATAAAQLATLPFLLAVFGTISLASLPANIIAAPLVAVAMPLAALAGLAGLLWQPLGDALAAPAALVAGALIRTVDALGAPEAYVSVGVPPMAATALVAATGAALLAALAAAGDHRRGKAQNAAAPTPSAGAGADPHSGRPI